MVPVSFCNAFLAIKTYFFQTVVSAFQAESFIAMLAHDVSHVLFINVRKRYQEIMLSLEYDRFRPFQPEEVEITSLLGKCRQLNYSKDAWS